MRELYAYSFKTDLSLAQLLARFNEVGPWNWVEWFNDNWGDYIWAKALTDPHRGHVKLIAEPDHYVINVSLESDHPDGASRFDEVRRAVFDRLLPAVNARDLAETDDYE